MRRSCCSRWGMNVLVIESIQSRRGSASSSASRERRPGGRALVSTAQGFQRFSGVAYARFPSSRAGASVTVSSTASSVTLATARRPGVAVPGAIGVTSQVPATVATSWLLPVQVTTWLESWIDRLALQRQHAEDALVDPTQRLAVNEALQSLHA